MFTKQNAASELVLQKFLKLEMVRMDKSTGQKRVKVGEKAMTGNRKISHPAL